MAHKSHAHPGAANAPVKTAEILKIFIELQGCERLGVASQIQGTYSRKFQCWKGRLCGIVDGMALALTEALFSKAAGWEAMKRARDYLELEQVLSSDWTPPLLKGVVQAGEVSFRAGLVIKGPIDLENICTCRESREWGKI